MRMDLAFGKHGITLDLPEGYDYRVLTARSVEELEDEIGAVEAALDRPVNSPPFTELAKGKKSAAIAVCDITRPTPNQILLPSLLSRLEKVGISRDAVTILIATGLHRPATQVEIEEIVGGQIAKTYAVANHNARDLAQHCYLGDTPSGTPVLIDERFVAADLHITVGFIEPHLMAGYSGARKLIAPGLAAQETIRELHSPRFMRDPRAVEGMIEGNPVHEELLRIARMTRHDFTLDVALTRERRIAGVFAGEPEAAHAAGMQFVARTMQEVIPAPADVVITTGAGYPLDLTFYQSVKGITAASHIVKERGRILLLAECREGAGAPEFSRMLEASQPVEEFLQRLEGAPVEVDQWQLEKLAMVRRRAELHYYVPGLPLEYQKGVWGPCYSSAVEAVTAVLRDLARGARVAVLPEGPYVLCRVSAVSATGAARGA